MASPQDQPIPNLQSPTSVRTSLLQTRGVDTLARFFALLLVFTFFAVMVENWAFVKPRNLENILRQSSVYATAALGMTLVIIAAGIDLSVGSVIALCVVIVAWTLNLSYDMSTVNGATDNRSLL